MSYGIIRIQKFQGSAIRGIQSHDHRERTSNTNPDIDTTRSIENYTLVKCNDYNNAVKSRISSLELKKSIRKDAVKMVQCLVTSDSDFFNNLTSDNKYNFFKQSLNFIAERYGKENIISATVHMDEKTPHMHVNFTPIKDNKLSAKSIFTRSELSKLHTDFYNKVGKIWKLNRGETREEKRQHLNTEEFKLKTKQKELEKLSIELYKNILNGITDNQLLYIKNQISEFKRNNSEREEYGKKIMNILQHNNIFNTLDEQYKFRDKLLDGWDKSKNKRIFEKFNIDVLMNTVKAKSENQIQSHNHDMDMSR
jgi:hypothetical protein